MICHSEPFTLFEGKLREESVPSALTHTDRFFPFMPQGQNDKSKWIRFLERKL